MNRQSMHPGSRVSMLLRSFVVGVFAAADPIGAQTPSATAPAPSADALFVTTELTDLAPGPMGFTGSVEWLHALSPSTSVNAGLLSLSLADIAWKYARVGSTWRPGRRTFVRGETDLGAGSAEREQFAYVAVRGSVIHQLLDGRVAVEFEEQYVDIHTTVGHIVKGGVTLAPSRSLTARAAVHASVGRDMGARALSVRVDARPRRVTTFAGFSAGRSRPVLVGLDGRDVPQGMREIFAGVTIPAGRPSVTLALDSMALTSARRRSLTLSWRLPL